MFKSDEENIQRELLALREENKKLKHRVDELESALNEQTTTLQAQESVNELAQSERLFAEATISAYEKVIELSRMELNSSRQIIEAQEKLQEYSIEKKIFLNKTIEAFTMVLELSRNELEDAYKTIGAYESTNELARDEILALIEKIKSLSNQVKTNSKLSSK